MDTQGKDHAGLIVEPARPALARRPIAALIALKLGLHLTVNAVTPYGFHRDELLYLAMGRHLRLWAMDFPPGIALLAEAVRALLGESLVAVRLVPTLAGTALVMLAALIARELGGGARAQSLAALGVVASPLFLRSAGLFQPVVLDQLTWTVGLYALARLCRDAAPRWWLLLGVALGAGLLVKFSAAFFGLAVGLGLLVTSRRAWLRTPWPWLAALVALGIGSPSLVGQLRLDWPVLGQMADLRQSQLERVTPVGFLLGQFLWGPATLVGLVGLAALLLGPAFTRFRVIGWSCVWAFAVLMVLHGKPYYAGPVYPTLLAAGGCVLERIGHPKLGPLARWGTAAALIACMAVLLPIGLPILAPAAMARYASALGATSSLRTNTGEVERLPQDYADMLGWEQQAAAVRDVYHSLPAADRAQAVLIAGNYGEAGALELFGPRLGLPAVVSPVGSYWFFGPGQRPGNVVVTIGVDRGPLEQAFRSVRVGGRVTSEWSVAEERELTIFVARGPRRTLQAIWPSLSGRH